MKRCALVIVLMMAGCAAKQAPCLLHPAYLPRGLHPARMDPLVSGSAVGTWTDGRRLVQVVAGPLADLGDGPDVKRTEVRGRTALYGPTGNVKGPLAVEWREPPSRCGPSAYAVIVKHITADEMLRIANGLRPS